MLKPVLLATLLSLTLPAAAADKAGYRLGDKLPQPKTAPAPATASYADVGWEALIPKNWDPAAAFKNIKLDRLQDGDPRAMDALEKLREVWDSAPGEPSLNGRKIRISGFFVPIEENQGSISEFLLVPYFGACVHSPPPPANQIIHVLAKPPVKGIKIMDPITVSGQLQLQRSEVDVAMGMGKSGYRMQADAVKPYQPAPAN